MVKSTDEYSRSRFIDLSRISYEKDINVFSDFLTLSEQSDLYECTNQLYGHCNVFGGYGGAERCVAVFCTQDTDIEIKYPISCVAIRPLQKKFAEKLGHRDYLGSLMNLGTKRSKLGDIIIKEDAAYVFVKEEMASYICEELTRIRQTAVKAEIVTDSPQIPKQELKESRIMIKSERIDGVVAKVFRLSRSQASELFAEKKIFCDGRLTEDEAHKLKPGVVVSVRGHGRFKYAGINGTSKKGSLYAVVERYM